MGFACVLVQVTVSAAAFAASHLSVRDGPALMLLGCVFGAVAVASRGNLAAATLAHVFYNLAVITGLLLKR